MDLPITATAFGINFQSEIRCESNELPAVGNSRRDERGAVTIVVALINVVLFVVAALAIDIGRLTYDRSCETPGCRAGWRL